MNFSTSQFAKLAAGLSATVNSGTIPAFSAIAYLIHELFVGDTISTSNAGAGFYAPAIVGTLGTPVSASPTPAIFIGATSLGSSYTLQSGDVGSITQIKDSMFNTSGTAVGDSNPVTVANLPTYASQNLIGGNISASGDYTSNPLFSNAIFNGRGFGATSGSSAGGISIDANGWPAQASQNVITTAMAGAQGTAQGSLPFTNTSGNGTYYLQYSSTTTTPVTASVTLGGGNAVLTHISDTGSSGNWTSLYSFVYTAALGSVQVTWSGAIQNVIMPIDGTQNFSNTVTNPFNPVALAYYSKFASLRCMDLCNAISATDTAWSTRVPNYANPTASFISGSNPQYAWEVLIAFFNAIYNYSGSILKNIWINTGSHIDTATYGAGLSALLNSYPINSGLTVMVEIGDEPWNTNAPFYNNWIYYCLQTGTELQAVVNSGSNVDWAASPLITAISESGTQCTITLSSLPAWLSSGNSYSGIYSNGTTGAAVGTVAAPVTITVSGTTLTFPSTVTTSVIGNNLILYFNTASNLINDGSGNLNPVYMTLKYVIRKVYNLRNSWVANRGTDRFVMNLQTYGSGYPNGLSYNYDYHAYAKFIGGNNISWLYGACIAPYISIPSSFVPSGGWQGSASGGWTNSAGQIADVQAIINYFPTALLGVMPIMISHITRCKAYGIKPLVYESDVDAANIAYNGYCYWPQVSLSASIQSAMTAHLNAWFGLGGDLYHYYTVSPQAFVAGTGASWQIAQTFNNTEPKIAAFLAFNTATRNYAYSNSNFPLLIPSTITTANVINVSTGAPAYSQQASNGAYYWNVNTVQREIDFLALVNRSSRFNIVVSGYDAAATVATIIIDGVSAGTVTMGGSGSGGSGTIGASSTLTGINLSSGAHQIGVQFAANAGNSPGVYSITLTQA